MKIPLNWLKDYVDIEISQDELVARLTAIGHMQDKKPEVVAGDTVLDLEVRQNRSDCLSILGIAKEVAAVTSRKIKNYKSTKEEKNIDVKVLKIVNQSPQNCFRFSAYKISGMDLKASTPDWMKVRLEAYGIKAISPVVDITNFVMVETGEPMHAFDADQIPNGVIKIRQARDGEKLIVLGGKEVTLTADDLIVADKNDTPISFSGLIGGATSGISDSSKDIIIEAATYNQAVIRRSSIRHSIRTEASTRHEKFLHTDAVIPALDRAVGLILEICGGKIEAFHETYEHKMAPSVLSLPYSEVSRLGGVNISKDEIIRILKSLAFEIIRSDDTSLDAKPHFTRTDIIETADLVEEVLRIYGYENIPSVLPNYAPPKRITSKMFELEELVRDELVKCGYSEHITETLVSEESAKGDNAIHLQNALNADKSTLRTSLLQGLKYASEYEQKHGRNVIKIFEIGKVYSKSSDKQNPYKEVDTLGVLVHDKLKEFDELANDLRKVLSTLNHNILSETQGAEVLSLDRHTAFVEVPIVAKKPSKAKPHLFYESIPHFSEIDISVSLREDVDLVQVSRDLDLPDTKLDDMSWNTDTDLAPKGHKYVLFKLKYRDLKQTKGEVIKKIAVILEKQYDAVIR